MATSATSGPAPAFPAAIGRMTTSGFACHRARKASRVTSITPRAACRRRKPAPSGLRISASNACRFASRARRRNSYGYCLPPRCEDGSYPNLRGVCSPPSCPEGYETIRGKCHAPCPQGLVRNPNNPEQCERIPDDEPDCPEGTKLNTQTNECERVPPPPPPTVKCKQGLEYNPRTKQCEPPPRVETTCPRGFTKLKNGKCQRIVEQPPEEQGCPRSFVLNRNTGECEPIRLNIPKACPEGTEFSRKRQRCVPVFNRTGAGI